MKTFSIYQDFKERNLSNSVKVDEIASKIDLEGECSATLILSKCLIDYPNTSKLIDRLIFQLIKSECSKRELTIKHNFMPSEEITLNYLFVGSNFFKIDKENDIDTLKKIIRDTLDKNKIDCTIEIVNNDGTHKSYITI